MWEQLRNQKMTDKIQTPKPPKPTPLKTAKEIQNKSEAGRYPVGEIKGLYLLVKPTGRKSWVLRKVIGEKRCDIGLGSYPTVTLAMAMEKARGKIKGIEEGTNPIIERQKARAALTEQTEARRSFESQAHKFISVKQAEWRSPKQKQIWENSLNTYAMPTIGKLDIADITTEHITNLLTPIWNSKTETAKRVQGRIEAILDWAEAVKPYRKGENPARWLRHLDKILPLPSKVTPTQPHLALPYKRLNEFMTALKASSYHYRDALMFCILTTVRNGDATGARWGEIDHNSKTWVIPQERLKIKDKGEHRVPLSTQAYDIIQRRMATLSRAPSPDDLIFTNTQGGKIQDSALNNIVKKLGYGKVATLHGFRSTFKDWASEVTYYPNEMTEQALAHTIDDKTEQAYRRGDMLQKRINMMQEYANFADKVQSDGADIINMIEAQKALNK